MWDGVGGRVVFGDLGAIFGKIFVPWAKAALSETRAVRKGAQAIATVD